MPFSVVVTSTEHYWVTLAKRRSAYPHARNPAANLLSLAARKVERHAALLRAKGNKGGRTHLLIGACGVRSAGLQCNVSKGRPAEPALAAPGWPALQPRGHLREREGFALGVCRR